MTYLKSSAQSKGLRMSDKKFIKKINGVTITLPTMKYLPSGVARKVRKLDEGDQFFTMLELLLSDDELAEIDKLDGQELEAFVVEWTNSGDGVGLGESSASAT